MIFEIPIVLEKMNECFLQAGFKAFLVGGAVRDMLLGKKPQDFDIATDATPKDVMKIFFKVIPTGIKHGTVTVHFMKHSIEVTTFRKENGYKDGRHPDSVTFENNIEEDLSRRDFCMNAVAIDLSSKVVVDPFEGQKDIQNKIIRAVGEAKTRFCEDGLRPVRALRFAAQLGFQIEEKTFESMKDEDVLEKVKSISKERFRGELEKIISSPLPSLAIRKMQETKILQIFIPELSSCFGCSQLDSRKYHNLDVFSHCLKVCDNASQKKPLVRLACLFHDIGKVQTRKESIQDGKLIVSFHGHEVISCKMAQDVMTRLHFSNSQIQKVCHLILNHMVHYESTWRNASVRRFLAKVGKENIDDLFDLFVADSMGKDGITVCPEEKKKALAQLKQRINQEEKNKVALNMKDLKVNGRDLQKIGIKAGPKMGQILKALLNAVLETPQKNNKDTLLELAKDFNFIIG